MDTGGRGVPGAPQAPPNPAAGAAAAAAQTMYMQPCSALQRLPIVVVFPEYRPGRHGASTTLTRAPQCWEARGPRRRWGRAPGSSAWRRGCCEGRPRRRRRRRGLPAPPARPRGRRCGRVQNSAAAESAGRRPPAAQRAARLAVLEGAERASAGGCLPACEQARCLCPPERVASSAPAALWPLLRLATAPARPAHLPLGTAPAARSAGCPPGRQGRRCARSAPGWRRPPPRRGTASAPALQHRADAGWDLKHSAPLQLGP